MMQDNVKTEELRGWAAALDREPGGWKDECTALLRDVAYERDEYQNETRGWQKLVDRLRSEKKELAEKLEDTRKALALVERRLETIDGERGYWEQDCHAKGRQLRDITVKLEQAHKRSDELETAFAKAINEASEPRDDSIITMLTDENRRLRDAGSKVAIAAHQVATEYDGVHRLMLAVSEWSKAMADEHGRDRRHHPIT